MIEAEYLDLIEGLRKKLHKGRTTNREEAYDDGIRCAMSMIKASYTYNKAKYYDDEMKGGEERER